MKTAISLPDTLFERAERAASRLNLNRSQLYAQALEEFLDRTDPERITAAFNAVYSTESSELNPALWQMQSLTLREEDDDEW
jgi:metal-responsive CopG/Arc/MetJ family transcriptional regulator